MRRIIGVLFLVFLYASATAQMPVLGFKDTSGPQFWGYQTYSNKVDWTSISNTITLVYTNRIDSGLYHNWVSTTTSNATVRIDLSIDSQVWYTVSSQNVIGNTVSNYSAIGKWTYYRVALAGSNAIFTLEYMGGR